MLHAVGRLAAGCAIFWAALAGAAEGVAPGRIVVGQSITLQGGRNEYGVAVLAVCAARAGAGALPFLATGGRVMLRVDRPLASRAGNPHARFEGGRWLSWTNSIGPKVCQ